MFSRKRENRPVNFFLSFFLQRSYENCTFSQTVVQRWFVCIETNIQFPTGKVDCWQSNGSKRSTFFGPNWTELQAKSLYISCVVGYLKVRKSRKENMLSWILPKNERWGNFMYWKITQRLFFGRIQDAIVCFWDLLTFSRARHDWIFFLGLFKIHYWIFKKKMFLPSFYATFI